AAYPGVVALALAGWALLRAPRTCTLPFALLAGLGVLLAWGGYNPLYGWLVNVPLFNLFRVPARFLLLFSFGVAALAAIGADDLLGRKTNRLASLAVRSSRRWSVGAL